MEWEGRKGEEGKGGRVRRMDGANKGEREEWKEQEKGALDQTRARTSRAYMHGDFIGVAHHLCRIGLSTGFKISYTQLAHN